MEDKENTKMIDESSETEDALSFCNLPTDDEQMVDNHIPRSTSTSAQDQLFEFFINSDKYAASPDIIFCGKIIHDDDYDYDEEEDHQEELNEYQKRDYLATVKSSSFRKPTPSYEREYYDDEGIRSKSVRYLHSPSSTAAASAACHCHAQKVNITALTSMSAKSKRRMFMFGPVKFKPEMELSAIKQRQSRRAPAAMFSPVATPTPDEKALTGGGKGGHWGIVRSLRCRAHLTTVLAKSFGCIPVAGVERLISVAK